jgi:hypothetical protein
MSRKIHEAPIAVTTEGALVVNVASFGPTNIEGLLARALDDDAELFIGIVVEDDELELLMERLDNASAEAVALVIGKRTKRRRTQR